MRAGFAACTSDIIVMIDGDGSTDGAEIIRFVAALVAGADYAKGSRFSNSGGSDDITLHRRLGNRVLCGLANLALGTRYTDLCYGYNAFWARHLPTLRLNCIGFEVETMMNIRAARAGLRVQEIPSHEQCRIHGASNLRVVVRRLADPQGHRGGSACRASRSGIGREVTSPQTEPPPSVTVTVDMTKD